MAEKQIRDLIDALTDYKVVKLGGQDYEVRNPDALQMLDYLWLQRTQPRIYELLAIEEHTPEESAEFSRKLDRFCRIVLIAPDAIQASLTDLQRYAVMDFFGKRSQQNGPPTTASAKSRNGMRRRRSGKKSSRG